MISPSDRKQAVVLIDEAHTAGSRKWRACEELEIDVRTYQRWRSKGYEDGRQSRLQTPKNKLTKAERQSVIDCCNSQENQNLSPKQIVPRLADQDVYLASESTMYRILREESQMNHRGRAAKANPADSPKAHHATGPNELFSWDITYLKSTIRGCFFYLYLFMDIYSRKIVGWEVLDHESSEQAADLLGKIYLKEGLSQTDAVVLHSDNGSPMKGATMLATMQKLGVVPSFSRPSVSNDNPFSESLFKTMKYIPAFPDRPFETVEEARAWVSRFALWYNEEHRHSEIQYVTPGQRHRGEDIEILARRKRVYEAAKQRHPERWSGETRNWQPVTTVSLNPTNQTLEIKELKQAA
jgi:transposase InsO family protein